MKNYVVGFAFYGEERRMVLLIEKNRPPWQVGLLNGVGGKIEVGELPCDAMSREFKEEVGIDVPAGEWRKFCSIIGSDDSWMVHFYEVQLFSLYFEKVTDETPFWICKNDLPKHIVDNLSWLIPMADAQTPVRGAMTEERGYIDD